MAKRHPRFRDHKGTYRTISHGGALTLDWGVPSVVKHTVARLGGKIRPRSGSGAVLALFPDPETTRNARDSLAATGHRVTLDDAPNCLAIHSGPLLEDARLPTRDDSPIREPAFAHVPLHAEEHKQDTLHTAFCDHLAASYGGFKVHPRLKTKMGVHRVYQFKTKRDREDFVGLVHKTTGRVSNVSESMPLVLRLMEEIGVYAVPLPALPDLSAVTHPECERSDTEDGAREFAATLSASSGIPYAVVGGDNYTDQLGSEVSAKYCVIPLYQADSLIDNDVYDEDDICAIYVNGSSVDLPGFDGDNDADDVTERHAVTTKMDNSRARKGHRLGTLDRAKNSRASARSRLRRQAVYTAVKKARKPLHHKSSYA